jgi:hypothetical protein
LENPSVPLLRLADKNSSIYWVWNIEKTVLVISKKYLDSNKLFFLQTFCSKSSQISLNPRSPKGSYRYASAKKRKSSDFHYFVKDSKHWHEWMIFSGIVPYVLNISILEKNGNIF